MARTVPSWIGNSYVRPVRSSVTVSVSLPGAAPSPETWSVARVRVSVLICFSYPRWSAGPTPIMGQCATGAGASRLSHGEDAGARRRSGRVTARVATGRRAGRVSAAGEAASEDGAGAADAVAARSLRPVPVRSQAPG